MGKSQRTKGAAGEREFFNWLSERLGRVVKRKLGQARDSGNDGDAGVLRIEVKRYRAFAVAKHLEQAERSIAPTPLEVELSDKIPVVAMREDGGPWMILLYATDFVDLAGAEILRRWPDGRSEV